MILLGGTIADSLAKINEEYKEKVAGNVAEIEDTMFEFDDYVQVLLNQYKHQKMLMLNALDEKIFEVMKNDLDVKIQKEEHLITDLDNLKNELEILGKIVNERIARKKHALDLLRKRETTELEKLRLETRDKMVSFQVQKCKSIDEIVNKFKDEKKKQFENAMWKLFADHSSLSKGNVLGDVSGNIQVHILDKPRNLSREAVRRELKRHRKDEDARTDEIDDEMNLARLEAEKKGFSVVDLRDVLFYFKDTSFSFETSGTEFSKDLSFDVWRKFMEEKECGKCPVCEQVEISKTNFEMGHIRSKARGGFGQVENGIPLCGSCNRQMGQSTLWDFVRRKFPRNQKLLKKESSWFLESHGMKMCDIDNLFLFDVQIQKGDLHKSLTMDEEEIQKTFFAFPNVSSLAMKETISKVSKMFEELALVCKECLFEK
jgi:5-methylcytosine-specific restriction endonuclease McrA